MDLLAVMKELHDSEINSGLQFCSLGGVEVWVGDEWNGIKARRMFELDDLNSAAAWLDEVAREHFPNSEYAKGEQGKHVARIIGFPKFTSET
jgi:hypothetical protein